MVTQSNINKTKGIKGLSVVSALTHPQILELMTKGVIQAEMFDERYIVETTDPSDSKRRYCVCYNLDSAKRETKTRAALLDKAREALSKIENSKKKATAEVMAARVGKALQKTKVVKFIDWKINEENKLVWSFKEDLIEKEKLIDGCYVIVSNVSEKHLDTKQLVEFYKKLGLVERAFRNLKTVQLEMRPIYHKTDERIVSHVFLCMLAYYIQWNMLQRLKPLFDSNGKHKERFWTFENVIERLKSIRREDLCVGGSVCKIVTQLDSDQKKIIELLGVIM